MLASKVDGVLLVVSAGQTTREVCRQAVQRTTVSGGKLLDIVMLKVRIVKRQYDPKNRDKNSTDFCVVGCTPHVGLLALLSP